MGNGSSGGARGMHMARRATTGGATARAPRASARPKTVAAREREALDALHALSGAADEKATRVAVLEEALREARDNPAFAARVRATAQDVPSAPAPKHRADDGPKLEIRHPEALARHNSLMPFDPYEIDAAYEHDQLRPFFTPMTQRNLRASVKIVQARNPGTKPRSMSANADMVDYIVEHVAGPGF